MVGTLTFELLLYFKTKTTILSNSEISLAELTSQELWDYMQVICAYFDAEGSLPGVGYQE